MYWCFHCYAVNDHPSGPCDACGQPIEAPAGLSYVDGLIWALRHPDGDRAVVAAQTLGKLRAPEAVPALRAVAGSAGDIYVRDAALRSVLATEDARSLGPWLEELARSGPVHRAYHRPVGAAGGAPHLGPGQLRRMQVDHHGRASCRMRLSPGSATETSAAQPPAALQPRRHPATAASSRSRVER